MDRYTMVDVRNKARSIAEFAQKCGFDTEGWGVIRGTRHYSLQYRRIGADHLDLMDLGTTAREACAQLDTFRRGLEEMMPLIDNDRKIKAMADAMRASYQLQHHPYTCNHCQLHVLGARPNWCDQYRHLIRKWKAGLDVAQSIHKTKYPISDVLKYAIAV